jgi:hypothetical protein
VVLLAAACGGSTSSPCGDAIDDAFAHQHAQRQTDARQYPDRRDELLDEQRAADLIATAERKMLVGQCDTWTDTQRACAAKGDIAHCVSASQASALQHAQLELSLEDELAAVQSYADRMCHCHDRSCVERTQAALEELTAHLQDDPRAPDNVGTLTHDAMSRFDGCMGAILKSDVSPCTAYVAAIRGLGACEKIPKASRDAMIEALPALEQTFAGYRDMPEESKAALNNACKQGLDAIHEATRSVGC